jgi:hypothetical protein
MTWKFVFMILFSFLLNDLQVQSESAIPQNLAAVVCMIRNEADILPYWIKYYSSLFGLSNIAVIDNMSDDTKTLDILKEWEGKGLRVIKFEGQFWRKGDFIAETFHKYFSHVHLAIPADADEFLVPYVTGIPTPKKELIYQLLAQFAVDEQHIHSCWSLEQNYLSYNFYFNDTVGNISYFKPHNIPEIDLSKKLARLKDLKSFQQGFHLVELHSSAVNTTCKSAFNQLGMLHYHHRNPYITAQRALNDIVGFGYIDRNKVNLQTINNYRSLIEKWLKKGKIAAHHKMEEIMEFIDKGPEGLLHNMERVKQQTPNAIIHIDCMDEILQQYSSSHS